MRSPSTEPEAGGADPRLERFKAEIAEMRIKEPNPARDAMLLRLGALLLVLGVVLGVVGYLLSHGTESALEQRDAVVVALIGVSVSVLGGALYLRYGLTQFLRLWLARMLFEQQRR